jgi:hypothetical protein
MCGYVFYKGCDAKLRIVAKREAENRAGLCFRPVMR